ncbi:hypothetical protein NL676_004279 [Syzygium grande]|nr:hypothetical protein NL676_004279 [Syzygium grande]
MAMISPRFALLTDHGEDKPFCITQILHTSDKYSSFHLHTSSSLNRAISWHPGAGLPARFDTLVGRRPELATASCRPAHVAQELARRRASAICPDRPSPGLSAETPGGHFANRRPVTSRPTRFAQRFASARPCRPCRKPPGGPTPFAATLLRQPLLLSM